MWALLRFSTYTIELFHGQIFFGFGNIVLSMIIITLRCNQNSIENLSCLKIKGIASRLIQFVCIYPSQHCLNESAHSVGYLCACIMLTDDHTKTPSAVVVTPAVQRVAVRYWQRVCPFKYFLAKIVIWRFLMLLPVDVCHWTEQLTHLDSWLILLDLLHDFGTTFSWVETTWPNFNSV